MGSVLWDLFVDCIVNRYGNGLQAWPWLRELCKVMNGSYYAMDTITADRILRVSRGRSCESTHVYFNNLGNKSNI